MKQAGSKKMSFSKDDFIDAFIGETHEHLDAINESIIVLKNNHNDKETLSSLLRDLHTVKGTARMLGFPVIEKLVHGLEDVFKPIRDKKFDISNQIVQLTFIVSDFINVILKKLEETGSDETDISKFADVFEKASQGLPFSLDEISTDKNNDDNIEESEENHLSKEKYSDLANITSISVRLERIDSVVRSFDNLIISQFRLRHELELFEKMLQEKESGVDLPRQIKEDLDLIKNSVFETQKELLNLRMLPIDIVLTPLKKEIENDAITLGKDVDFDVQKSDFMLDKLILQELKSVLLHLVRNSLDHGIESAEERRQKGKPERGFISISMTQISNYLKIFIKDDGRGIDFNKILKKAIEMNLVKENRATSLTSKDLLQLMFMSGISTKENVSALSGRGVGLDVVRNSIDKIKGKISVESEEGKGTTFELSLPLSLATQQGIFIFSGKMKFMVPSNFISEIIDAEVAKIVTVQGKSFISLQQNKLVPIYFLAELLGTADSQKAGAILVVEYLEKQVALVVSKIENYADVIITPLPKILESMKSVQAVVYDDSYSIIPILNVMDIIELVKEIPASAAEKKSDSHPSNAKKILVVDDSPTTRNIEKSIFESAGFLVETAEDGQTALEKLETTRIDAVVSDIEMPRLDGHALLKNMRAADKFKDIPVVIVSGAYSASKCDDFLAEGAQEFVSKSDFNTGKLLAVVKELLNEK